MKKLKVVTIVGTRPEIIRLSRLIPKLDEYTDHILVHTGQNYDHQLSDVFFEELEIRRPDYYLNVETSSFGAVMGDTLKKSEEVFLKEKPDAVMILGDTNSAIAAIVAERLHIPVYHMEAGNRSFDKNVPEELNRKIVDHASTYNLPYTDFAARNLIREGIEPRFVYKTGSPMAEILEHYLPKINASNVLKTLGLQSGEYLLASIHRQENVDDPEILKLIFNRISEVAAKRGLRVLVSTHPRTKARISAMNENPWERLAFHEPFGFFDYVRLQKSALCVISDSGTISEEASILRFPAVTLRNHFERWEALETGGIVKCPTHGDLEMAVSLALTSHATSLPEGYEVADFSTRVLGILQATVSLHH